MTSEQQMNFNEGCLNDYCEKDFLTFLNPKEKSLSVFELSKLHVIIKDSTQRSGAK